MLFCTSKAPSTVVTNTQTSNTRPCCVLAIVPSDSCYNISMKAKGCHHHDISGATSKKGKALGLHRKHTVEGAPLKLHAEAYSPRCKITQVRTLRQPLQQPNIVLPKRRFPGTPKDGATHPAVIGIVSSAFLAIGWPKNSKTANKMQPELYPIKEGGVFDAFSHPKWLS